LTRADRNNRRYSLRITLSTIIIGLLIFSMGGTVVIILTIRTRSLDMTSRVIQKEVSQHIATKLQDRFGQAEDTLKEYLRLAKRGLVPIDDLFVLSEHLAARIRYDTRYEWFGFLLPDGRGCSAIRREDGSVALFRTRPAGGTFEVTAEAIDEDGRRTVLETSSGEGTDFRETPWFMLGAKHTEPVWTKRYVRAYDGAYGWACTASVQREGGVAGVFGMGFGLAFLEDYLKDLYVAKTGRAFLLNRLTGDIVAGPAAEDRSRLSPVVEKAVALLPQQPQDVHVGKTHSISISQGGIDYVVALEVQELRRETAWINALVIPETEIVGFASRYLVIGLSATGGLFLVGLILAGRISKRVAAPLRIISADLERVGGFDISEQSLPTSRIDEIAIVADSAERMKASLRSFSRYVPTELVRDLLREGQEARLGGKTRSLTLFFSDVEGFTTISERMTPQSLVDALGEYLDVVTGVVGQCHGVIDKYIGDGILAFFNAPHDDPDHVSHACLSALRVQEALESKRVEWEAAGMPLFHTRIGLHTDDVVVGNIGTPERFSYTVIGDGVNLSARLESLNKAYGTWILVSDNTQNIAGNRFEWRRIDLTAVKGRQTGESVYELLGESGKVTDDILRARDRYEAALEAYLNRRFEEAIRGFEEAAQIREKDKASVTMRKRAEMYLKSPPSKDWDGVFVHTEK